MKMATWKSPGTYLKSKSRSGRLEFHLNQVYCLNIKFSCFGKSIFGDYYVNLLVRSCSDYELT